MSQPGISRILLPGIVTDSVPDHCRVSSHATYEGRWIHPTDTDQKVAAKDVRELEGLLRKEGDIGPIVASGGFTSEAEREIRSSSRHIETMDLERVISLWQEHSDKLSQAGKALLPLVRVFFLAPAEE